MARDGYLWQSGEDTIHKPKEEQKALTPREKRRNFWYYHKVHLLIALLCVAVLGWTIYEFTSRVDPDYQISLVTYANYPDEVIKQMEEQLTTLADDRNGDGKVVVRLNYYHFLEENTSDANGYLATAVKFQGDIAVGDSMLFFVDDRVITEYCTDNAGLFTYGDGSTPQNDATDLQNLGRKWTEYPFLTRMQLTSQTLGEDGELTDVDFQEQMKDLNVCMRAVPGTNLEGRENLERYNQDTWNLLHKMEQ